MPRNITCFTQGLRLAKRWNWDSNSVWISSCFWIQFPADIIQILFLSSWSQRGKWQNVECLLSTFQIFTDRISLEQFSINNDCCWRTALSFCLYYCGYCLFSLIPNIVPIISDCLFFMTWTPCWEIKDSIFLKLDLFFRLLLFSHSVMSDSLQPHGLQHARFLCPSPSPKVCSNSCPLSRWCHPTISSSVIPFSCHLQSFPASGSLLMSWLFT